MKKCFTINHLRKQEEILSYEKLLKDNIYQAIEIFYPYNQSQEQLNQYTESVKYLINKYPNTEVVLHLPHAMNNGLCLDEHLNKGSLEIMFAAAKYANYFQAKKLTLHLGHINQNKSRDYYINKIIPILKKLCNYVKQFNQIVMIENMPGSGELGYSPLELLKIFEETKEDNLKFIFDTGHAHVSEYDDTSYLTILKDYLYHIHYSDNDGSRDAHARIGTGTIDFNKHFEVLKSINYNELHCMEIIYHTVDDLILYEKDIIKYE